MTLHDVKNYKLHFSYCI